MERRIARVSKAQWVILLDFLERNPRLGRTGVYNNSAKGRAESSRLWKEVTELLNAERTGTTKTPKNWSIYVSNYKSKLKKTVAEISSDTTTEGGPPLRSLDNTEQRMLALLRQEVGRNATGELQQSSTSATPQSTHDGAEEVEDNQEVRTEDRLSTESMEPQSENMSAQTPSQAGSSTVSPAPADAPPVRRRRRARLRRCSRPMRPDTVSRKILCLLQQASERRAQRYREGLLIAQSITRLADIVERYVAHIERQ